MPFAEAESLAGSKGMIAAIETSAKDDVNVDQAFYKVAKVWALQTQRSNRHVQDLVTTNTHKILKPLSYFLQ